MHEQSVFVDKRQHPKSSLRPGYLPMIRDLCNRTGLEFKLSGFDPITESLLVNLAFGSKPVPVTAATQQDELRIGGDDSLVARRYPRPSRKIFDFQR
jgi:hypothetical protein